MGLAILRLALGTVFVAHGVPKLFPVWGGSPAITAAFFDSLGLGPALPLALAVGVVEVVGGLALLAGAYARWVAFVLAIELAAAAWSAHLPSGFFINWKLDAGVGHGFEFHLVLIAALACLVLSGAGALSVDGHRTRAAETDRLGRARLRRSN